MSLGPSLLDRRSDVGRPLGRTTTSRRVRPTVDAEEAFRQLGPAVRAYLRGQHVADPDDLLGEVFYRLARSLDRFEGDAADLRRWAFTIARNGVIDDRRQRARLARTSGALPRRAEASEGADHDDELVAALAGLTEDEREVVGLRFIADLSLEEVADLTERTVGAVTSVQHRALERLAGNLRPAGSTEASRG